MARGRTAPSPVLRRGRPVRRRAAPGGGHRARRWSRRPRARRRRGDVRRIGADARAHRHGDDDGRPQGVVDAPRYAPRPTRRPRGRRRAAGRGRLLRRPRARRPVRPPRDPGRPLGDVRRPDVAAARPRCSHPASATDAGCSRASVTRTCSSGAAPASRGRGADAAELIGAAAHAPGAGGGARGGDGDAGRPESGGRCRCDDAGRGAQRGRRGPVAASAPEHRAFARGSRTYRSPLRAARGTVARRARWAADGKECVGLPRRLIAYQASRGPLAPPAARGGEGSGRAGQGRRSTVALGRGHRLHARGRCCRWSRLARRRLALARGIDGAARASPAARGRAG
jgi:hypothetical protein